MTADIDAALARFNLTSFRTGQREVIETVLSGRDTLCVMPTGGGKSLCYQLPALLLPGVTLVISPLIALMKDQEDRLHSLGLPATALHSNLPEDEQRERFGRIVRREVSLVYVAPERFRSRRFIEALRGHVSLLAVDEAHCISEWGHDFRPDYARIGWAREQLGSPAVVALTATATDIVRRDIVEQLKLHEPAVFVRGFDRPNLHYVVTPTHTKAQKQERLRGLLRESSGGMIVYCASRKNCEEVADVLKGERQRKVSLYHAGLMPDDRKAAQERFMSGRSDVIVATNAFGMGVDKADIRAVVHYNLPGTLEAYYQEAGRAGRDGQPAVCEMLFSTADRFIQEFFIEGEFPDRRTILGLLDFLRQKPGPLIELTREEIKAQSGLGTSDMAIGSALKILEQAKLVERLRARQNMAIVRIHEAGAGLDDRLPAAATQQRRTMRLLEAFVGDQRGEDVYFHPDSIAQTLGVDRPALNRALDAICKKLRVEYIPPFRGSATRIVDATTPCEQAPIDFAELDRRRNAERQKLDRVFDYAQLVGCRRQAILSYFGEKSEACGNCDNCTRRGGRPAPRGGGAAATLAPAAPAEDLTPAGRSAVRLCLAALEELRGRFGKHLLAGALAGSSAKDVTRFGLQKRVCYGSLGNLKQADVVQLLEATLAGGLAEQAGDPMRPTIAMSERGAKALAGDEDAFAGVRLPAALAAKFADRRTAKPPKTAPTAVPKPAPPAVAAAKPPPPVAPKPVAAPVPADDWRNDSAGEGQGDDFAEEMFLSSLRDSIGDQTPAAKPAAVRPPPVPSRETTPPPAVPREGGFPSRAGRAPSTKPPAAAAPPDFVSKSPPPRTSAPPPPRTLFDDAYHQEPPRPAAPRPAPKPNATAKPSAAKPTPARPGSAHPHYHWTAQLLLDGRSVSEVAEIRRLEIGIVLEHAVAAANAGAALPWPAFAELPADGEFRGHLSLLRSRLAPG